MGGEPYFKVELAMPVEQLDPLLETFCPMETVAMHRAGISIICFYREVALQLAQKYGVAYPERLERLMVPLLETMEPKDS